MFADMDLEIFHQELFAEYQASDTSLLEYDKCNDYYELQKKGREPLSSSWCLIRTPDITANRHNLPYDTVYTPVA